MSNFVINEHSKKTKSFYKHTQKFVYTPVYVTGVALRLEQGKEHLCNLFVTVSLVFLCSSQWTLFSFCLFTWFSTPDCYLTLRQLSALYVYLQFSPFIPFFTDFWFAYLITKLVLFHFSHFLKHLIPFPYLIDSGII